MIQGVLTELAGKLFEKNVIDRRSKEKTTDAIDISGLQVNYLVASSDSSSSASLLASEMLMVMVRGRSLKITIVP